MELRVASSSPNSSEISTEIVEMIQNVVTTKSMWFGDQSFRDFCLEKLKRLCIYRYI